MKKQSDSDEEDPSAFHCKTEPNEELQTLDLTKLGSRISYTFDYEVNSIILPEGKEPKDDEPIKYLSSGETDYIELNPEEFNDHLLPLYKIKPAKSKKKKKFETSKYDDEFEEIEEPKEDKKAKKANIVKRWVSKQKRRFTDSGFDLDMSYITERVIAMGYPSTGVEVIYRNSLSDVSKFFQIRCNNEVKVYNLCLEKDRIYNKNVFPNPQIQVGLFPSNDHNPCPIKLILECCIDICLFILKHPNGTAAVHCKAGKGRTGVMICSYLVFSGLCRNSEVAFRYYARIRTKDNTGVTIASQKRYIKYFETFLSGNFEPPYIRLIPKILKNHFSHLIVDERRLHVDNILKVLQSEKSYFLCPNMFKIKGLRIGPLSKGKKIKIKICNFTNMSFKLKNNELVENFSKIEEGGKIYYEMFFKPEIVVSTDTRFTVHGALNFFFWLNFWHSSWEKIKNFFDSHEEEILGKSPVNMVLDEEENEKEKKHKKSVDMEEKKIKETNIYNNFDGAEEEGEEEEDPNVIHEDNNWGRTSKLGTIIDIMQNNTDLNELLNTIGKKTKEKFDKENMEIKLTVSDLDKFEEKEHYDNIETTVFYGLA